MIEKFKEAVSVIGVGKWQRISNYLKLYDINIAKSNTLCDLWVKLNKNQDEMEVKKAVDAISIQMIEHNFVISKVNILNDVQINEYSKYGLLALGREVQSYALLVRKPNVGIIWKQKNMDPVTKEDKYIQLDEIQTDQPLVKSMIEHARKFKFIAINLVQRGLDRASKQSKFQYLFTVIKRREVEIIINQLAYISEMLRVKDRTTQRDCDIIRFSNLVPPTIDEILNSPEYKIIFAESYEVVMFNKFLESQKQQITEQEQEEQFSIDLFKTPAKSTKHTPTQNLTKPSHHRKHAKIPNQIEMEDYQQIAYDTQKFKTTIEKDFEDEQQEDSFELELSPQQIVSKYQSILKPPPIKPTVKPKADNNPKKQVTKQEAQFDQAINANKNFESFFNEKLKEYKKAALDEYRKLYGNPV